VNCRSHEYDSNYIVFPCEYCRLLNREWPLKNQIDPRINAKANYQKREYTTKSAANIRQEMDNPVETKRDQAIQNPPIDK